LLVATQYNRLTIARKTTNVNLDENKPTPISQSRPMITTINQHEKENRYKYY